MKNPLTLLLAFFFLAGPLNLRQFTRIPALVGHFQHHSKDHGQSIGYFLNLHYGSVNDTDNDDKEDHSLPFKSPVYLINLMALEEQNLSGFILESKELPRVSNSKSQPENEGNSIWQPPRTSNTPAV